MNEHVDMASFIAPKSDQINADDLIGGPRTITITRVTGNEGNAEQPVNIYFADDHGKPFRPCKSMRRVMVKIWGPDASKYAGKSMTMYRDPKVKWGGMEVGGIRISHMTGLEKPETMALTETRSARKPYTVQPLHVEPKADKAAEGANALIARIDAGEDITADAEVTKQRHWLAKNRPDLAALVDAALAQYSPVEGDDPFADAFEDTPPAAAKADELIASINAASDLEALTAAEAEFQSHREALGDEAARVDGAIVTARRALERKAA
jgi:hypothetical protein